MIWKISYTQREFRQVFPVSDFRLKDLMVWQISRYTGITLCRYQSLCQNYQNIPKDLSGMAFFTTFGWTDGQTHRHQRETLIPATIVWRGIKRSLSGITSNECRQDSRGTDFSIRTEHTFLAYISFSSDCWAFPLILNTTPFAHTDVAVRHPVSWRHLWRCGEFTLATYPAGTWQLYHIASMSMTLHRRWSDVA